MKSTITIVHSVADEIEVNLEKCVYVPNHYLYIVPPMNSLLQMAKTIYQAEKERSEWIRRYENALQGLNYWKDKALTK